MDAFDKLTLECLVNKQTYKKYLAKTNPELLEESNAFYDQIQCHRSTLLSMIEHLIDEPDSDAYNRSVREHFDEFMRTLLYHIEVENRAKQTTEIYEEENEKEEMLIDVTPDPQPIRPPSPCTTFSGIEYWKKHNVFKKH